MTSAGMIALLGLANLPACSLAALCRHQLQDLASGPVWPLAKLQASYSQDSQLLALLDGCPEE